MQLFPFAFNISQINFYIVENLFQQWECDTNIITVLFETQILMFYDHIKYFISLCSFKMYK